MIKTVESRDRTGWDSPEHDLPETGTPLPGRQSGEAGKSEAKCFQWTREPKEASVSNEKITIKTEPHTDLWQRTYYHFRNDNAPVLQRETEEKYFSFIVKTDFSGSHPRFDQCGVVMYLDSENWLKASVEYENEQFQHLGSVVTNHGYSDWATTAIPADVKEMWYRFGVYACSPEDSRFTAVFTEMRVTECAWKAHDGQKPDGE